MNETLKVLVLDDEKLVRFTISAYLKSAGFEVQSVESPAQAIAMVKSEHFHAIVSDVMMGEMDGFQVRSLVREFNKDVPIVFLTSMVNDSRNSFMARVTEDIHSYYVSKSAARAELIGKLRQVVTSYVADLKVRKMGRALERDLNLASLVQKAMLPPWAQVTADHIHACCWQPFQSVSGDMYERFVIGEGKVLFIVGDIAGHGTTASLATTAVQAFLKQFATYDERKASRIHKIASRIHEFLDANLREVAYLAATILYVDFVERKGLYLNCGNPELGVYSLATGERRDVNVDKRGALPLGLVSSATYEENDVVQFDFDKDEIFFVMTDGVFDLANGSGESDTIPPDIVNEVVAMAVRNFAEADGSGIYAALPHRIMSAFEDLGYATRLDDVSFHVIGVNRFDKSVFALETRMMPAAIDETCSRAREWVENQFGTDQAMMVDLLLNEHLMNINRHGLDDFGRQHEISVVSVSAASEHIEVTVWDRGAPWKSVACDSDDESEQTLDRQNANLSGSGRGRSIIQKVTDSISVDRYMNVNKTIFRLKTKGGIEL